jgi:hypothetical protein
VSPASDPRLRADLARSLRDEIGALDLYERLARSVRDDELARLVVEHAAESRAIVARTRALAAALGPAPREWSVHRPIAAACLAQLARWGRPSIALRLCQESEAILARRYQGFARFLAASGALEPAARCDALATRKAARARALAAWVPS